MVILKNVKGTKSHYWKRDLETKVWLSNDYIYRCYGLNVWFRYKEFAFRFEEVLFYLGFKEYKLEISYKEIYNFFQNAAADDGRDFKEILLEAEKFYNSPENQENFHNWKMKRLYSCQ